MVPFYYIALMCCNVLVPSCRHGYSLMSGRRAVTAPRDRRTWQPDVSPAMRCPHDRGRRSRAARK